MEKKHFQKEAKKHESKIRFMLRSSLILVGGRMSMFGTSVHELRKERKNDYQNV